MLTMDTVAVRVEELGRLSWRASLVAVSPSGRRSTMSSETLPLPLYAVVALIGDLECAAAIAPNGSVCSLSKKFGSQYRRATELLRLCLGEQKKPSTAAKRPVGRPPGKAAPKIKKRDPCAPRKMVLHPRAQARPLG